MLSLNQIRYLLIDTIFLVIFNKKQNIIILIKYSIWVLYISQRMGHDTHNIYIYIVHILEGMVSYFIYFAWNMMNPVYIKLL
jgi:hypothetical protein